MTEPMRYWEDGAELRAGAGLGVLADLASALADVPPEQAGVRLFGIEALRTLLSSNGAVGALAGSALRATARPVRAVLFDKSAATNWSLAWHQDRTICVKQRLDIAGFGPWTIKAGQPHVAPPFALLARMITLRVHLDDTPESNAPLLVAPGTHRLGLVPSDRIADAVKACGTRACLAHAGDVWLYATPILHASEAARDPKRRRVLQVDYADFDLPDGLEWTGV